MIVPIISYPFPFLEMTIYINIYIYIYIYIVLHRHTISSHHNDIVLLDTWDSSSWDRNLIDITPEQSSISALLKEFLLKIFPYTLLATGSAQFLKRAIAFQLMSPLECSTHGWKSIYTFIRRQTASLYHNSSVWLNTRDASSWHRNPNRDKQSASFCWFFRRIIIKILTIWH